MLETRTIDGEIFTRVPFCNGKQMALPEFLSRFEAAIFDCINVNREHGGVENASVTNSFGVEQFPYNGDSLFTDEIVFAPNTGRFIADGLSRAGLISLLWKRERFPRYVHLGMEQRPTGCHFFLQISCCYSSMYAIDHPNPIYPFRVLGSIRSVFRT